MRGHDRIARDASLWTTLPPPSGLIPRPKRGRKCGFKVRDKKARSAKRTERLSEKGISIVLKRAQTELLAERWRATKISFQIPVLASYASRNTSSPQIERVEPAPHLAGPETSATCGYSIPTPHCFEARRADVMDISFVLNKTNDHLLG